VNVTDVMRGIDPSEKSSARTRINRGNSLAVVSESGLYKLVMRSAKPEAKIFQDWVTRVVRWRVRQSGNKGFHSGTVWRNDPAPGLARLAVADPITGTAWFLYRDSSDSGTTY
jgi:prophage antirepressor-like protein